MPKDDGWLARHFRQDATLGGTLIAFGLSSVVMVVAASVRIDLHNDAAFALAVVLGPVLFLPGPIVLIARLLRGTPRSDARCAACGARPASEVRYLQLTGIVLIAVVREVRLPACSRCSREAFARTTGHSAVFGWWTPLTPLVVPWVIVANVLAWVKGRWQAGGRRGAEALLGSEREYAVNLLRSKEFAVVADVLARKTGLPREQVERWLQTL